MSKRSFAESRFRSPGGPGQLMHTVSWMDGSIVFEHRHWNGEEAEPGPSRATHHRIVLTESGGELPEHMCVLRVGLCMMVATDLVP